MKKYILLYVYNNLSDEELLFWEKLDISLKEIGYTLFLLLQITPKKEVSFLYGQFTEKLDNVSIDEKYKNRYSKENFDFILEREEVWYGKSEKNRLAAAKIQKYKYECLLKELNPGLLILGNGQHSGELILKREADNLSIPVIYIERGPLPKSWHLDSLGITAGTTIANTCLSDLKLSNRKSYSDYISYYFKSKTSWWHQPIIDENLNIRERFNIDENQKLILFANQLDNDTSNFLFSPFFNNNLEAFEWFCQSLSTSELNGFVLIKKHPHYKGDEMAFDIVLKKYNVNGAWINDISLFNCLEQSDLVCAVNSTVVFEALIYKKPVLQLGKSILSKKESVYNIKSKIDLKELKDWFELDKFDKKLDNYELFMSYLIENELSFFFDEVQTMGLNSVSFFVEKLKPYIDTSKKGVYPKIFFKSFATKKENKFRSKTFRKIKNILKKIFGFK